MGGTLLKNKNKGDTTIISLCRRDNIDQAPKFKKACSILKSKSFISNLEDENLEDLPNQEVIKRIKQFIVDKNYDYIFTHRKNGEYGHKRHVAVHNAINEILKNKLLSAKKVFFFSYTQEKDFCVAVKNSNKFKCLKEIFLKDKKILIKKIYGFKIGSFEEKSCKKIEVFNLKK